MASSADRGAGRLRLGAAVGFVVSLALLVAAPAGAVGTDDVEMTPVLPRTAAGGFVVTSDTEVDQHLWLRNLSDEERHVAVHTATALRQEGGGVQLGPVGSAPWLGFERVELTLAPHGEERVPVLLDARSVPREGADRAAFVLQSRPGTTLVLQAAQIVEVRPGLPPPSSVPLILLAAALLAAVTSALVRRVRQVRAERRAEKASGVLVVA